MPTQGNPVGISASVHNVGWDVSAPTIIRFHEGTPPAVQIGGDQALASLPVNGTAIVSVPWTAPSPGTYELCVVVDPNNAVPEGDETNNIACGTVTVISSLLPDLTLASADIRLTPGPPLLDGTVVRMDVDVRNVGGASSPAAIVRVHDGTPPAGQVGLDQPLPSLSPGASATISVMWNATPPGGHDLCVVVDPDENILELNEANNSACVTANVLPPETRPDYTPVSPQPSANVRTGLSVSASFSVQVTNRGNATAAGTAILAFFNASTPGGPFASFAIPSLMPLETSTRFTAPWTSPSIPGTYTVLADVDFEDNLFEWDEGNNRFAWTVEVLAGPVTNLVIGPPNVLTSDVFVTSTTPLSFTILDQGGSGIRNTTYRVDGGPWINYTAAGPFALAGDGGHRVEWFSEDNPGNVEPVASQLLLLDDTPPVTALVLGNPRHLGVKTFVTSSTPVSFAASDGGATPVGIAALEYRIDGNSWTPYSEAVYLTGEGTRAVDYRASDRLGNVESFLSATVVVDDTAPAISIDIGTPQYVGAVTYVTSATYFAPSAVDGGTIPVGLGTVEYLEGGNWTAYSAPFAVAGTDGPKIIAYRAADLLGNEFADQLEVVLDDAAPVTTSSPGDGTYPAGTAFALTAADSGAGAASTEYSLDGLALRPYSAPFVIPEGTHILRYRSTDRLNNTEGEHSLVVTIEGAPLTAVEWNWKPLVAAVFSAILVIVGGWSASKAPARIGTRPRLRAFATTALPFVLAEAATGVASVLTGVLAIPPLLGAGTAVDLGILFAGVALCAYRVRAQGPSP
ncbi:MAG TPA: CARDB domain-containing protein [Thermoplasmata archaeon]|nr:CARDB domain-containing protein [Thermoplasmata archaeon]